MAMKMRGWPSWKTSKTEVIPASAPALMSAWPMAGSRMRSRLPQDRRDKWYTFCIPVITPDIKT